MLALFSDRPTEPLRYAPVNVVRRHVSRSFATTVAKVGWSSDAYECEEPPPSGSHQDYSIDALWNGYEPGIADAIRALVADPSSVSGRTWVHCLVPFVAATLVRSPEFLSRFSRRMLWLEPGSVNEHDNALGAIPIELSRLLAVVMAGTWTVVRPAAGKHFIANDRGWFLIGIDERATPGFFVPLTPAAVLHVRPSYGRELLHSNGLQWMTSGIEQMQFDLTQSEFANHCIAQAALNEIYGPDAAVLEANRRGLHERPWISDIDRMGFPWGRVASPTQLDWMRLACLCMTSPGSHVFRPPALPPDALFEMVPFQLPLVHFVDAPNDVSGLLVSDRKIFLELFSEPFLCAPVAMENTARLLECRLLQTLFHKYGRRFEMAEEEFRLVMATLRSPSYDGDRRHTFVPTRLLSVRQFLDGEFLRSQGGKKANPGKTFEWGPDPLCTADLRLRFPSR